MSPAPAACHASVEAESGAPEPTLTSRQPTLTCTKQLLMPLVTWVQHYSRTQMPYNKVVTPWMVVHAARLKPYSPSSSVPSPCQQHLTLSLLLLCLGRPDSPWSIRPAPPSPVQLFPLISGMFLQPRSIQLLQLTPVGGAPTASTRRLRRLVLP